MTYYNINSSVFIPIMEYEYQNGFYYGIMWSDENQRFNILKTPLIKDHFPELSFEELPEHIKVYITEHPFLELDALRWFTG